MQDRSIPQAETLRRVCMLVASLTIGIFIWILLGDSDSLVAEETPRVEASTDRVLAQVSGIPVTESEVRSLVADELEALEARRRALMDQALEARVRQLLVEVVATEQGLSPEELINREVDLKIDQVPQPEVDAFYASQHLSQPRELVEGEIRRRLRLEAFLRELEDRPDLETGRELPVQGEVATAG